MTLGSWQSYICTRCHKVAPVEGHHLCRECSRIKGREYWNERGATRLLPRRLKAMMWRMELLRGSDGACAICGSAQHSSECGIGTLKAQIEEVLSNWERQCSDA